MLYPLHLKAQCILVLILTATPSSTLLHRLIIIMGTINIGRNLPRNTDWMINSIVLQNMNQFWCSSASSNNTESGQKCVPDNQSLPQSEPRSILHQMLATKNDQNVNATVPKSNGPIFLHPCFGIQVLKFVFKVEHIGIVGWHSWVNAGVHYSVDAFFLHF